MRLHRTAAALLAVAVVTLGAVGPHPATAERPPRPARERPHPTVVDPGHRPWGEALGPHEVEALQHRARGRRSTPPVTTGNVLLRNGRLTALPDVPGAELTAHRGLNDRGQTVGPYIDADGTPHGFLHTPSHKRDGRFRTIDIPGAQFAVPYDVNNRGQIVGIYVDEGAAPGPDGLFPPGAQHAFLWDRGKVTIVDPPDTVNAPNAYSINDRGQIVGVRIDPSGNQIGFLHQPDGRYVTLDPPGAAESKAFGINDRGQVVGPYLDDSAVPGPDGLYPAGSLHGYLWDHGRYKRLDVPGARATVAAGINDRGDVVGEVKDANGRIRGFARLGGRYRFVDGPGDGNTSLAVDINDRGDILIPAPGVVEGLVDLVE
jgi:uncharacterized membrane protein